MWLGTMAPKTCSLRKHNAIFINFFLHLYSFRSNKIKKKLNLRHKEGVYILINPKKRKVQKILLHFTFLFLGLFMLKKCKQDIKNQIIP